MYLGEQGSVVVESIPSAKECQSRLVLGSGIYRVVEWYIGKVSEDD